MKSAGEILIRPFAGHGRVKPELRSGGKPAFLTLRLGVLRGKDGVLKVYTGAK
jgi:hypothetical protein